jgi:DME family drug/metabolite transporter
MRGASERVGLGFAALCALNGALWPAVAKLTTLRGDAFLVATVTSLFAAGAALVVLTLRGELPILVRRREGPWLVAIGALGTALAFGLYFEGARRASAIEAALCLQTEPAYSLLFARVFLGQPATGRRLWACALTLLGIALALGVHRLTLSWGIALLLLSPLCWQSSHVIVLRALTGISPPVLTGARYVYGGLLLALFFAVHPAPTPTGDELASQLPLLAFQGIVLSYLGTMLWYAAIARLDLARTTAIVVPSIPLLSFGASFALLGEVATPLQWLGLLLTAGGVLAFVTAPHAALPGERIPAPTTPLLTPDR